MKNTGLLFISLVFSLQLHAKVHTLQKGDTLANIARKYYGEPVWGPKGTINKIYKLNPWALTSPNSVEPGQVVTIEEDSQSTSAATEKIVVTEAPALSTKEDVVLPPIEPIKKIDTLVASTPPDEVHALPSDSTEVKKSNSVVEAATKIEAKSSDVSATTTAVSAPSTATTTNRPKPKSYFIIAPTVSIGKISTSTDPSSSSYDLSSDSSYGVRVSWDHWWTTLFSSVLSYNLGQIKSTATNDTTSDTYASTVTTHAYEFALLNKFGPVGRFGLGAAYGNHLFVEGFALSPANQSVYNIYYWNAFLLGEFNLLSTALVDLNLTVKLSPLPADVGHDHDLKPGFEYAAGLKIIEKLGESAFSFGINYFQNNQARVGTNATRSQTTVDLGFMF